MGQEDWGRTIWYFFKKKNFWQTASQSVADDYV